MYGYHGVALRKYVDTVSKPQMGLQLCGHDKIMTYRGGFALTSIKLLHLIQNRLDA